MPRDPLIGLVGKPSSGKSTTLNSLTDASSKVGNFPFTTIDPQRAIGYLQVDCACTRYSLSDRCTPNYGSCHEGRRSVPIELLDVAGLVPGAHEGKGLGNKFLDDLRHADALIHVVDVSGTTDAEVGDSTLDLREFDAEMVNHTSSTFKSQAQSKSQTQLTTNASRGSIKRRHTAVKSTAVDTLQAQFSGYGSTSKFVQRCLDKLHLNEPLELWSEETIHTVVVAFIDEKFPTVLALNKIDHPDADKNISKIAKMYDEKQIVLCSAISEVFLRRLAKQGYVKYIEGSEFVDTREDLIEMGDPEGGGLKEMDEKLKNISDSRVENLKDMVLYRFGSTGVNQCLSRAAELLGLVPIFPVRNIHNFSNGETAATAVFRDCVLVEKYVNRLILIQPSCLLYYADQPVNRNSTVGDVARKVMGDVPIAYVEGAGGNRVSEEDMVAVGKNDILSFKVGR
ncbi:hypothetical protein KEM54_000066 [Ascosphaera aggregata]|nr:hypothetical protein KEM54_000066 [Ascosphaera aggregata]